MKDTERNCQLLVDCGLLSADEVEAQLAAWRDANEALENEEPVDFLDWLVEKELLTEFQRDAVGAGHAVPGLKVGPYRVYEMVAAGRLGSVFRARHDEFDQQVSLKIFPPAAKDDEETLARIGRELRVSLGLEHPNVLRSFDVGCIGTTHYLALEVLHGETLAARLEREGSMSFEDTCRIGYDLAQGLAYLHENDVVHRNVCPETIWITSEGVAKIMEFGAARDAFAEVDTVGDVQLTTDSTAFGELALTAPEQTQDARRADALSDIYALGATLHVCLAGEPPFTDKNPVRLVVKILTEDVQPISERNSDVPVQFDDTLAGMLAKAPEDRFRDAGQVAAALNQYLPEEVDEERIVIVDVSPGYLEWLESRRKPSNTTLPEDAVGISPELVDFLTWISDIGSPGA